MVRWKKPKRFLCRKTQDYERIDDIENNDEDSDDDVILEINHDGEHEDNYRNPMIRMAYIPIVIIAVIYSSFIFFFALFIEASAHTNSKCSEAHEKEKMSSGLLTPPMKHILEDRTKYKNEIKLLKTFNVHLTYSTWINSILEILALIYSFLLLLVDRQYLYPLSQVILYLFTRINFVYTDIYGRFFSPSDVVGAITTEVIYDLIRWQSESKLFKVFPFTPCPLPLLLFPIFLSILQVFANQKHTHVYESERLMRKQIREKYIRDGPLKYYRNIIL
ncbi:uncharacterized protein CELE_T28D9.16 [Caenorhabditis elegans]|uniref:Uncharacterized protein n=1 Tax=Caenorhabditis elegans TaxID=6239 RepID=A0A1C3NSK0_CAEEL|nr:Uncharacterized protein CELE_T28D9.16 [Caenorhabditis elegans]SBV53360.1 Uncharacterized protein CELE_T28D9.16 [Caenorhabditis elegans]|eukprot:NP_001040815.2 Uncharacterized protein CELE_T28D9.16 [Caenorhabditis elegans]